MVLQCVVKQEDNLMPLPLLGLAAAGRILGPIALKAAKSAYKVYKKSKAKNKVNENKFISDKANKLKKKHKKLDREFDDVKAVVKAKKSGEVSLLGGKGNKKMNRQEIQNLKKKLKKENKDSYDKFIKEKPGPDPSPMKQSTKKLATEKKGVPLSVKSIPLLLERSSNSKSKKMKAGGVVKKHRGDGIAKHGRTKGRII